MFIRSIATSGSVAILDFTLFAWLLIIVDDDLNFLSCVFFLWDIDAEVCPFCLAENKFLKLFMIKI